MTFDPFGDFDTRGYLRNTKELKDPEAVRLFEHTAFRLNVEDALAALRATARPLGYQDTMDTHKRLFGVGLTRFDGRFVGLRATSRS